MPRQTPVLHLENSRDVRCRILLSKFPEGVTAKNIKDLAAELGAAKSQHNGGRVNLVPRKKSNGPPKRAVSF